MNSRVVVVVTGKIDGDGPRRTISAGALIRESIKLSSPGIELNEVI